jgi:hypothetical protein
LTAFHRTFRRWQGAINMIVPVLLLGFIFPAYATERLPYAVNGWAFRIGGVLVAAALGVAAGRVALVSKI